MYKFEIGEKIILIKRTQSGGFYYDYNLDKEIIVGDIVTITGRDINEFNDNERIYSFDSYGFGDIQQEPFEWWSNVEDNFKSVREFREQKLERIMKKS